MAPPPGDDRWQQIEDIFQRVVAMPPEARPAFLDEACGVDPSLRKEVESLMVHYAADGSTFVGAAIPTTIAHYRISAKIGEGGMGAVYRATDTKLGRDVAIKVLPAAFAADPDRMARFTREAHVLASLNHPNIASIYGVEERALILELVEGDAPCGPLPVEEALPLARQLAEALEYAHEHGIIHRDLKPANIKVTPEGVVKVLDFGLAKAMSDDPSSSRPDDSPTLAGTRAGILLGTAGYIAPEQAKGAVVDKRADIWAFGAVFFELLTGKRLIDEPTASERLAAVLKSEMDLARLPETTPPGIRRLIERCLKRDPKQRLRDVGEARIVLDAPEESAPAVPPRAAPALLWIAATAVFALATALLAFIHFRETPPEAPVSRFLIDPPEGLSFVRPALSPDGRKLAFNTRDKTGKTAIWIRPLDSLAAYQLAGTEGGQAPFWSPDSKSLAFYEGGKLKRIEVSGGPAVTLCAATPSTNVPGSWSRDGVILYQDHWGGVLYRVAAVGGVSTPATVLRAQEDEIHLYPRFLPDGDHFLYLLRSSQSSEIRVASLRKGGADARDVMDTPGNFVYAQGRLLYIKESTLMAQPFDLKRLTITGEAVPVAERLGRVQVGGGDVGYFTVSENGLLAYLTSTNQPVTDATQLAWVDRSGKLLEKIGNPVAGLGNLPGLGRLNLARTGKTAAVSVFDKDARSYDIWLYDLIRKTGFRFTLDSAHDEDWPVISPDGAMVVFGSDRKQKGIFDLYRKASNGSGTEELLLADGKSHNAFGFSPDGKFLLYSGAGIMVLPLTGNPKPFQFSANGENAQFSPDGRWIAYQVDRRAIPDQIFMAPFPGPGGVRQISTAGALARWRGDGKELFYVIGSHLMTVEINAKHNILQFGKPQDLFSPVRMGSGPSYDVSPDGKRFLLIQAPYFRGGESLTLVQNWAAGLHR